MNGFTISPLSEIPVSDVVKLWNEEIGERFPMSIALWKQNTTNEPNVMKEGSLAVIEEGQVRGFIVAKRYMEKLDATYADELSDGSNACLSENHPGTEELGSKLLQLAEQALLDAGV